MIPEIKYRQYVVVPKKPKMSTGKIASQTAHATFMALEKQRENSNKTKLKCDSHIIEYWKNTGMCVIVLQCKDSNQLMGIARYLEEWKVPNHLYIDEGLTEVDMGTPTALATGVLPEEYFWMFKKLELFK